MSCCEICDRNPGCGNECGSCHLDVCPECRLGVLHEGVATLPNECCAAYFLGRGWGFAQWKANVEGLDE